MTLRKWLATALAILAVGEVLGILVISAQGDPELATMAAEVANTERRAR